MLCGQSEVLGHRPHQIERVLASDPAVFPFPDDQVLEEPEEKITGALVGHPHTTARREPVDGADLEERPKLPPTADVRLHVTQQGPPEEHAIRLIGLDKRLHLLQITDDFAPAAIHRLHPTKRRCAVGIRLKNDRAAGLAAVPFDGHGGASPRLAPVLGGEQPRDELPDRAPGGHEQTETSGPGGRLGGAQGGDVRGIGGEQREHPLLLIQERWNNEPFAHEAAREEIEHLRSDGQAPQSIGRHHVEPKLLCQPPGQALVIDEPHLDRDLAEARARPDANAIEDGGDLLRTQQPERLEDLPEGGVTHVDSAREHTPTRVRYHSRGVSYVGNLGRTTTGRGGAGRDAATALREAMRALSQVPRAARPRPGVVAAARMGGRVREAWLEGVGDALADAAVLSLGVQPGAILLGDVNLLDGADRGLADGLYAAGARALTVFGGAEEDELVALAGLLLTLWDEAPRGGTTLEAALWGAELPHVHMDFEPAAEPAFPIASPAWERVLGLLAPGSAPAVRSEPLSMGGLNALRALHATKGPEAGALGEVYTHTSVLPPELASEATVIRAGADLDMAGLGDALGAILASARDSARGVDLATAIVALAVELLGGTADPAPIVHATLALLDADLSPGLAGGTAVREGLRALAIEPLRGRLRSRVPVAEPPDLRGTLFSLLSLVEDADAAEALAEVLPAWAIRVLGDTILLREGLLREGEVGPARLERVRARLAGTDPPGVLLGLAMAARLEEAGLMEPVLGHASDASADVREGVLFALRQSRTQRTHELVRKLLEDEAENVRIEALRYCVAHRVVEAVPSLEARLADPTLAAASDAEVRSICIAYGRIARSRAEGALQELAQGRARATHPLLPRMALVGLRAIGTASARVALERIATEVPRLREEAVALLAGEPR